MPRRRRLRRVEVRVGVFEDGGVFGRGGAGAAGWGGWWLVIMFVGWWGRGKGGGWIGWCGVVGGWSWC